MTALTDTERESLRGLGQGQIVPAVEKILNERALCDQLVERLAAAFYRVAMAARWGSSDEPWEDAPDLTAQVWRDEARRVLAGES